MSRELDVLRTRMLAAAESDLRVGAVDPVNHAGAENLLHYVALRQQDNRDLQFRLAELGLSSLGRAESQVLAATDAVRRAVACLAGLDLVPAGATPVDFSHGQELLEGHAETLLGPARHGRRTRIMVTLPSEAATDPQVVEDMVRAGAELFRVNCAHDDATAWRAMVRHIRLAESTTGRSVRITMDLAGPKLRTGPVAMAPGVLRIRPERDQLGRVVAPALAWLTAEEDSWVAGATTVPVADPHWLLRRRQGERIDFHDTRGSHRSLLVTEVRPTGVVAEIRKAAYLNEGIELTALRDDATTDVGWLQPRERKIPLQRGDLLLLVPDLESADPTAQPPRIGCTLLTVFTEAREGDRIFFDDGKIGGVIGSVAPDHIAVRITDTGPRGGKLGAAKGINLPDTTLTLPALTDEDIANLPAVVELADAVSLSFVRSADDVTLLQEHLAALGGEHLGLILKVETVSGFQNLPDVLLAAMRSPSIGVMIARGDLAVEAGYARLAEVQEEILWLCEAAHVPVIWATQVLDTLARTGHPSRAEVTDAAMSGRAECVMLNKGPFVTHAVEFLDDILRRMDEHQRKKSALLRQLHAWDNTGSTAPVDLLA